jgi:hypothetical protein
MQSPTEKTPHGQLLGWDYSPPHTPESLLSGTLFFNLENNTRALQNTHKKKSTETLLLPRMD